MISPPSSWFDAAGAGLAACAVASAWLCAATAGVATARTDVPISKAAEARMKTPSLLCVRHNMPETAVGQEEREGGGDTFPWLLLQDCYTG